MLDQLAINSNTYSGFSLEDAVKGASKAGFKQIELAAVEHTPHVLPSMTHNELEEIKELLSTYGMKCIGIGARSNILKQEGVENLLKGIDLAAEFECKYVITATGEPHNDTDLIDDDAILAENLQPIIEKCKKHHKTLVLETHGNNYPTGISLKRLANKLNNEVKINYDTANVIYYGNILPYEDLEESLDLVEFIHLKDKLGANQEWNFPAIGDGNLDFRKIFQMLTRSDFTGPISVEVEFTPAGPANLEEVNQAVTRSFNYLTKLLG